MLHTIYGAKTKMLIKCAVTTQLIGFCCFAYADCCCLVRRFNLSISSISLKAFDNSIPKTDEKKKKKKKKKNDFSEGILRNQNIIIG